MMVAAFYFDVLRIWREQVFAGAHTFIGYAGFIATIQQNHRDIQAGNVRAVRRVRRPDCQPGNLIGMCERYCAAAVPPTECPPITQCSISGWVEMISSAMFELNTAMLTGIFGTTTR